MWPIIWENENNNDNDEFISKIDVTASIMRSSWLSNAANITRAIYFQANLRRVWQYSTMRSTFQVLETSTRHSCTEVLCVGDNFSVFDGLFVVKNVQAPNRIANFTLNLCFVYFFSNWFSLLDISKFAFTVEICVDVSFFGWVLVEYWIHPFIRWL